MPRAVVGVVGLLLLASCAAVPLASPSAEPFFFPRHGDPMGTGDAALLVGVPRLQGPCLVLVAEDGGVILPIWPADAVLSTLNDQPAVLSAQGELLVETGDAFVDIVRLAGSEAAPDQARALIGDAPERCGVDRFWVVSDVLSRP